MSDHYPTFCIKKQTFGYHIELLSLDGWTKIRGGKWALTKAGAVRIAKKWKGHV